MGQIRQVASASVQSGYYYRVKLSVHDLPERQVAVLVNERREPGAYDVKFDAAGLASGVYLYKLTAGEFVQTRTMVLAK